MLEVVPGSTNTGTVIRQRLANLGSKRENVDIDLMQFNLFFKMRKGFITYKDTFQSHCLGKNMNCVTM